MAPVENHCDGPLRQRLACHDVLVPTATDPTDATVTSDTPGPAHRAPLPAPAAGRITVADPAGLPATDPSPVRAALRPGTVVVVRDHTCVQVGLAPDRAVVVAAPATCGPHRLAALLDGLDGGADLSDAAARAGIPAADLPEAARILVHLAELGHVRIADAVAPAAPVGVRRPAPVRRVHLLGAGQISEVLRGPLSVNGCKVSTGPSPGLTLDPHRPPWHRRGPAPDLVVLAGPVAVDPVITVALARAGQAHMHVHCRDGRVVVGPTVVPGASPCLRCADLYRADRDPRWPFVAAQLIAHTPRAEIPALTAATALVLAEVAATREPARSLQTVGATVEINPAEGLWHRRDWPADERCTCGAATRTAPLP